MPYKPYMHVERFDTEETEGLLDNDHVVVTAKIDGTNSCIWWEDGQICTGSRKRKLSLSDDNAKFCSWVNSDNIEATKLREYCEANPNLILYGEWLGYNKFIGHIKQYDPDAKGHFFIFDVFDIDTLQYLPDETWRQNLADFWPNFKTVDILAILDHPTLDDIAEIANKNKFLLNNSEITGEGVVCKAPNWRNCYGRQQYGKLVLDEYKQNKKRKKTLQTGQVEPDIIEEYITDAELSKTIAKVCTLCNTDKFDKKSSKMIGMAISLTWKDLLIECPNFVKKFKLPTIDFALLKSLAQEKVRKYLNL